MSKQFAGAKIVPTIGTAIPIPIVGTIIGMGIGFALGIGISMLLDININEKRIIDHIDDAAYNFWNNIFK